MLKPWQSRLVAAAREFEAGFEDRALEHLRTFHSLIAELAPGEQMDALGTAANYLEEKGPVAEAIAAYRELLALAAAHHPTDVRTARDWVRLAGLYGKIAETELENDALEKAAVVYAALDPPDRARLEPDETATVDSSLNRSRAARRSRRGLREPLDTRSAVLGRIAAILRGDFQHLLDYPETLVQQVHNGLAPFRDSRPVEPLLTRLGAFLDAQDRAWCEICGVLGPGRDGWLQRQLSTTTQFPADVQQLLALPDGRLLAFADDGLGWLARPGEPPSPMAVSRPPRKGRQAVATVGWRMAWIDERENLFFFQVDGSVLRSEGGAARPRARLVAPHDAGFIAVFADGRVVRFDARGEPTATVTAPAIEGATQLLPWRDGTRAAVVVPGAAQPGEQGTPPDSLRIVTFEPADAGQPATLPPQVRSIEHSWNAGELLVGSIDGLRCWRIADALPKGSGGSTDNIVRSNAGAFTAMHQGSIWVIHHEAGLQAMLPTPADALVAERLVFEDRDGETALHVLTGAVVDTWNMQRVFWRPSVIVGWIEQASFSPDGNELIALSPVGTRFLWETERGTLLEQEPFDRTEHMIAWAASGEIGATCHDGMVEIAGWRPAARSVLQRPRADRPRMGPRRPPARVGGRLRQDGALGGANRRGIPALDARGSRAPPALALALSRRSVARLRAPLSHAEHPGSRHLGENGRVGQAAQGSRRARARAVVRPRRSRQLRAAHRPRRHARVPRARAVRLESRSAPGGRYRVRDASRGAVGRRRCALPDFGSRRGRLRPRRPAPPLRLRKDGRRRAHRVRRSRQASRKDRVMGLKDYFKRTMEKPAPQPQVSGDYWKDLEGLCRAHVPKTIEFFRAHGAERKLEWAEPRYAELIRPEALARVIAAARAQLLAVTSGKPGPPAPVGTAGEWFVCLTVFPSAADADFLRACPAASRRSSRRVAGAFTWWTAGRTCTTPSGSSWSTLPGTAARCTCSRSGARASCWSGSRRCTTT